MQGWVDIHIWGTNVTDYDLEAISQLVELCHYTENHAYTTVCLYDPADLDGDSPYRFYFKCGSDHFDHIPAAELGAREINEKLLHPTIIQPSAGMFSVVNCGRRGDNSVHTAGLTHYLEADDLVDVSKTDEGKHFCVIMTKRQVCISSGRDWNELQNTGDINLDLLHLGMYLQAKKCNVAPSFYGWDEPREWDDHDFGPKDYDGMYLNHDSENDGDYTSDNDPGYDERDFEEEDDRVYDEHDYDDNE
jgi:hypothetical protein